MPKGEAPEPLDPEDAGEAPALMVDIIEGGKPQSFVGFSKI